MATTIEELRAVMRMELKPFMRDLQQMNGINAKAARQVEQTWLQTNRRLDGIGKNMANSLIAPLTGVGAALGARELIRLTDVWTDLNGRVRIAAGGIREGADVMERLSDMARRTYSSLETTAESYLTNSQALKELGYNTNQQLDFTEALNNALVVSGAKGQRAEQVIQALGKAMAFGELRGENLNTVIQTGGRVAQALAEGLGVTTNELRKLGEQGKLKSSSVFTALTSQMQTLREEADGMQATIGDALQLLQNSFLEYVGGADQASGASARVAESIILVADNMDTVASAALVAAQAIIGALAGRAMVGAGIQILSTAKALGEFVRIARTAQGLGGLGPAFASLGAQAGVIGLVVGGAAALALGHFANQAIEAKLRTERVNEALDAMGLSAKVAAESVNEVAEAQERLSTAKGIADAKQLLEDLEGESEAARANFDSLTSTVEDVTQKVRDGFIEAADAEAGAKAEAAGLTKGFKEQTVTIERLNSRLTELASVFPNMAPWISEVLAAANAMDNLATATERQGAAVQSIGVIKLDPIRALEDRDVTGDAVGQGNTWITEQQRRIALTKEQRDLEDEIARLRKDVGDGFVSESQLTALAKANLARQAADRKTGKDSKSDPFGDATKSMQERIDGLLRETAVIANLNPLINDYGYAVEKARAQIELENAAKKAGLPLDADRIKEIARLASGYAQATADAARLAEAQAATVEQMDNLRDASRDALQTIVDGFLEGKDAGEIFASMLKTIGSQLISMGMGGRFGKGGGDYGVFGKLFGFSDGGYTGAGGKHQPAGVVHKGEVVWSQRDVAKAGGVGVVEAMRRGVGGYADGGVVAMPRLPSIPVPANSNSGPSFNFAPQINMTDGSPESIARLERSMAKMQSEFEGRVKRIVSRRSKEMW